MKKKLAGQMFFPPYKFGAYSGERDNKSIWNEDQSIDLIPTIYPQKSVVIKTSSLGPLPIPFYFSRKNLLPRTLAESVHNKKKGIFLFWQFPQRNALPIVIQCLAVRLRRYVIMLCCHCETTTISPDSHSIHHSVDLADWLKDWGRTTDVCGR